MCFLIVVVNPRLSNSWRNATANAKLFVFDFYLSLKVLIRLVLCDSDYKLNLDTIVVLKGDS